MSHLRQTLRFPGGYVRLDGYDAVVDASLYVMNRLVRLKAGKQFPPLEKSGYGFVLRHMTWSQSR